MLVIPATTARIASPVNVDRPFFSASLRNLAAMPFVFCNLGPQLAGDGQQVADGHPSIVAGSAAPLAAPGLEHVLRVDAVLAESLDLNGAELGRLLALIAKFADQPLRHQQVQSRRQQHGRDPQVQQPGQGRGVAVAVNGGQHQVAGLRRAEGDFGRFLVAYLAHADHVGVLAEDAAQRLGERDVGLGVDLDLAGLRQMGFDRVFHRNHVVRKAVDLIQHRVQGGGLAAAGRPADQHHAGRFADGALDQGALALGNPGVGQGESAGIRVQHPDRQLLAVEGPGAGHAEGEGGFAFSGGKGAVLRPAPFRNVHARNGLDAVDDRPARFRREIAHHSQRAVDAEPDGVGQLIFRVDEDVAGPLLQGLVDDLGGQFQNMPVCRPALAVTVNLAQLGARRIEQPQRGIVFGPRAPERQMRRTASRRRWTMSTKGPPCRADFFVSAKTSTKKTKGPANSVTT